MKKYILLLLVFTYCNFYLIAQSNIQFNINHKLANADFEMEMGAKNNIDNDFNITRLEYYISEISIVHDGGVQTDLNSVPILVNASEPVQVDLGTFDINTVEKVRFYIGVEQAINHDDPATFPAGHPLAPQFPSMHWGWASGYRFVAIEGYGSSNFNQRYEIHGLGDENYYQTRIASSAMAVDGVINLNIDADYTRILEDIAVNNGTIEHGTTGDAKTALLNFRDYVFTEADATTSVKNLNSLIHVKVSPNPAKGLINIQLAEGNSSNYTLRLMNSLGQEVAYYPAVSTSEALNMTIENSGWYILQVIEKGTLVGTQKIIIE